MQLRVVKADYLHDVLDVGGESIDEDADEPGRAGKRSTQAVSNASALPPSTRSAATWARR